MNTMGNGRPDSRRADCRSRPLGPGSRTSSTRHAGRSAGGAARKGWAVGKVSTGSPTERSSRDSARRTDGSSSTTYTTASGSCLASSPPLGEEGMDRDLTAVGGSGLGAGAEEGEGELVRQDAGRHAAGILGDRRRPAPSVLTAVQDQLTVETTHG